MGLCQAKDNDTEGPVQKPLSIVLPNYPRSPTKLLPITESTLLKKRSNMSFETQSSTEENTGMDLWTLSPIPHSNVLDHDDEHEEDVSIFSSKAGTKKEVNDTPSSVIDEEEESEIDSFGVRSYQVGVDSGARIRAQVSPQPH